MEDENTTSYEDDLELLEAELQMWDATQKGKQATGGRKGVASKPTLQEDEQTLKNKHDAMGTGLPMELPMECQEKDKANIVEPMMKDSLEAQLRME